MRPQNDNIVGFGQINRADKPAAARLQIDRAERAQGRRRRIIDTGVKSGGGGQWQRSSNLTWRFIEQYIDGEWAGAEDGRTYEVINPSTEEVMAVAPASTRADAKRAVAAARRSFDAGEWRLKSQLQRTQIMFQIVEHLQEVSEDWGLLESQNAGAALRKTAVVDVPLAIEWFRSMAEQALSIPWYEPLPWIDSPYVSWNFVQREPIGVCAGIIPWNYPLIFAMWKIAPALAMGNSIVLKPSPQTPLSALAVARAIDETGLLPRGVLNVVTGDSR